MLDILSYDIMWYYVWHYIERFSMVWHNVKWFDMILHDVIWNCIISYDMTLAGRITMLLNSSELILLVWCYVNICIIFLLRFSVAHLLHVITSVSSPLLFSYIIEIVSVTLFFVYYIILDILLFLSASISPYCWPPIFTAK